MGNIGDYLPKTVEVIVILLFVTLCGIIETLYDNFCYKILMMNLCTFKLCSYSTDCSF